MVPDSGPDSRAIEAAAKALVPVAQSVAGILSQTTEVVLDALRWGGARFGRLADVAGGLVADPLYAWRVANRVRLWQRLQNVRLPAGAIPSGWAAKVAAKTTTVKGTPTAYSKLSDLLDALPADESIRDPIRYSAKCDLDVFYGHGRGFKGHPLAIADGASSGSPGLRGAPK